MKDALRLAGNESSELLIRHTLPKNFPWGLFLICCALMAAPLGESIYRGWRRQRRLAGSLDSGLATGDFSDTPGALTD
jgi:hypothetical protein